MSEAFPNPLLDLHNQPETEFTAWESIQIVQTFGQPQAEYAAIHKSAGMIDLPQRGILQLTGKDRLTFLNNLLTNQTYDKAKKAGLQVGSGVYAFLLDPKTGRILADMNVLERGDFTLLEMDVRLVNQVKQSMEKYLFGEKVAIESRVGALHEIAFHGPQAHEILKAQAGIAEAEALKPHGSVAIGETIIWRDDPCGVPGYHLLMIESAARKMWVELVNQFMTSEPGKRKLHPIGWAAYNSTRIEAGRPLFGIDFDDKSLPAETGQLARAVSFTKGCYPGQEVVARMHARGQLAKQIVGIRMDGDALPIAGAQIFDPESNQIGAVTSSTISPILSGAAIAFGMVKRPHYAVGTKVQVPAEGAIRAASIMSLPFLGGQT